MMFRPTGYRPDPAGHRRTPFHRLSARLAGGALPDSVSLFDRVPGVMDQGQTGSCSGHASAMGLCVALGLPWVPSPAEIYRNGRAIDRNPGDKLEDDGAQPNQVFRAINEFGIRPMVALPDRFSDADPATINLEPMFGDLETEAQMVVVGDYAIESTGAQRLLDIRTSLARGKPVCVAIAGGSARFQAYSGGIMTALNAPLDHYTLLLGYHLTPDGLWILDGLNSYGDTEWGDAGKFHIDESEAAQLGDIVALDVRKAA